MGDVSKKNFFKYFCKIKFTFQTLQTDIFWTLSWPFSCDYSFWLRDLKFCMCITINKTCWKNGKDLSNGAPKIKLWNHTKKTHFPVFAKNFRRPWMKLKIFFANFQTLGPLGCQGWVVIPQNVKKSQNHCTLILSLCRYPQVVIVLSFFKGRLVYVDSLVDPYDYTEETRSTVAQPLLLTLIPYLELIYKKTRLW